MRKFLVVPVLVAVLAVVTGCEFQHRSSDFLNEGNASVVGTPSNTPSGGFNYVGDYWSLSFWRARGFITPALDQCANQAGDRRGVGADSDHRITETADNGALLNTSFRDNGNENGPAVAVAFGCKSPGYASPAFGGHVGDPRTVYNNSYRWTQRKVCVINVHENGHHVGFTHESGVNAGFAVMGDTGGGSQNQSVYPDWSFPPCGELTCDGGNFCGAAQAAKAPEFYQRPYKVAPKVTARGVLRDFIREHPGQRGLAKHLFRLYKAGKWAPPPHFITLDELAPEDRPVYVGH